MISWSITFLPWIFYHFFSKFCVSFTSSLSTKNQLPPPNWSKSKSFAAVGDTSCRVAQKGRLFGVRFRGNLWTSSNALPKNGPKLDRSLRYQNFGASLGLDLDLYSIAFAIPVSKWPRDFFCSSPPAWLRNFGVLIQEFHITHLISDRSVKLIRSKIVEGRFTSGYGMKVVVYPIKPVGFLPISGAGCLSSIVLCLEQNSDCMMRQNQHLSIFYTLCRPSCNSSLLQRGHLLLPQGSPPSGRCLKSAAPPVWSAQTRASARRQGHGSSSVRAKVCWGKFPWGIQLCDTSMNTCVGSFQKLVLIFSLDGEKFRCHIIENTNSSWRFLHEISTSNKSNLEHQTTIYKWLFQLDDSKSLHSK